MPGLCAATTIDGWEPGKDAELDVVDDKPDGLVTVQSAKDQNDEKLKSWSATRSVGKPNLYTDVLLGSIRLRIKNNLS